MPTQNVNLTKQQVAFIRESIAIGNFSNISEVVRAGLRLLEQQEKENKLKLEILRQAANQGFDAIDHGNYETITSDSLSEFMASVKS